MDNRNKNIASSSSFSVIDADYAFPIIVYEINIVIITLKIISERIPKEPKTFLTIIIVSYGQNVA